ncbi:GNAT family N-acetyltransferase [Carboxylicivirga mesophila]|uniref:GNAT family N-acetyltransferase n=1 Tax=Carboxylicivirga mesophila TaxID=1166478 RepID=A0ABS5KCV2_9BACT|nr:GNAT family protein [Carboxylicivirga mesophila]MBS2212879.1 GNAT family N-acetyltransferase [Carboxylicivirga mesophila]
MKTEELVLRALEPDDIDLLYQWENNMDIWEVSNTLTPFSKYQLQKFIEQAQLDVFQTKQLRLIIELEPSKKVVGMIDLFDFDGFHQRAGIGIIIHQNYRQQGFAYEALIMFTDYCFNNLGLNQLYANISVHNTGSIALFEKAGFMLVGIKKKWRKTKDGFIDEALYQLLR